MDVTCGTFDYSASRDEFDILEGVLHSKGLIAF